ncbi:MAG TPA: inositol monophosphatase family protein [Acidimicrobiales bacterium]|nr:inositol monophosphatase family protein [Acidimicrobiales bacterium]
MQAEEILATLSAAAYAVARAVAGVDDWSRPGRRPGQYLIDTVADAAALDVLIGAGFGVLSEESGLTEGDRRYLAVLDPIDGSTNASRGLRWYATSICVVDEDGPYAALVVNQARVSCYEAVRDQGATRDGRPIAPSKVTALSDALVSVSGYPPRHLGWRQLRSFGAAALELCAVADGTLDGFAEWGRNGLGAWDYLGGMLVCTESGAAVGEALGRELVLRTPGERRSPVAAASAALLAELLAARAESSRPRRRQ